MHEKVLIESRTLRGSLVERTDALDKVKALAVLPDGVHVTTEMVAAYFVIHKDAVRSLVRRHREELTEHGMKVLRGADLREFKKVNLTLYPGITSGSPRSNLTLYTRRTVLNIAMLLQDSHVARRIRAYLLDAEERTRPGQRVRALERRVDGVESALGDIGPALRELGPLLHRMNERLERAERRLDSTDRVIGAMSQRLADVAEDVRDLLGCTVIIPPQTAPGRRPRGPRNGPGK